MRLSMVSWTRFHPTRLLLCDPYRSAQPCLAPKKSGDPLVSRRKSCLRAPYLTLKKSADPHWWRIEIRPEELRRQRRRAPYLSQKKSTDPPTGGVSKSILKNCVVGGDGARCLSPKKSEDPPGVVSKSIQKNCVIGGGARPVCHQKNLEAPLEGHRNLS